jgi:diguanylate cyclase (GGDEF)-like protein/PAS domain S-box-containing protein
MVFTSLPARTEGAAAQRAVLVLDADGRVRGCTRRGAGWFGRRAEQVLGWPVQVLLPTLPLQATTAGYNRAFAAFWHADGGSLRLWGIDARGARLALSAQVRRIAAPQGDGVALLLRRSRCGVRERCASALQRYLDALRGRPDGVIVTDLFGAVLHMNPACERLLGCTLAQVRGAPLRELVSQAHPTSHATAHGVFWIANGTECRRTYVEPSVRPFVDGDGRATHRVYALRDISEHVLGNQRLMHLAQHDALTGLPNRALFEDRLQHELARRARHGVGFSLLYLDVDRFKAINDGHGHDAGDQVLLHLAQRLVRTVRREDTVARLDGDEFAVILAGTTQRRDVASTLDAMLSALAAPLRLFDGATHWPSVSVGVARCPLDGHDAQALVRAANAAMYRAKHAGGQRAHFATEPSGTGVGATPPTCPGMSLGALLGASPR